MAGNEMMLRMTFGVMLVAASVQAVASTSSAASDRPDFEVAEDASAVSAPTSATSAQPAVREHGEVVSAPRVPTPSPERALSANPLWAIPLAALSGTRDRPIFSPSRRPPAPVVAPIAVSKVAAPKPKEPETPQLNLVGTIASGDEGFGIFLDQSTKAPLRLKVGEDYQGWKLRSVQGRQAILEKDQQTVTLELPQPSVGSALADARGQVLSAGSDNGRVLPVTSPRPRPDR
jgi:hypothetical protein